MRRLGRPTKLTINHGKFLDYFTYSSGPARYLKVSEELWDGRGGQRSLRDCLGVVRSCLRDAL